MDDVLLKGIKCACKESEEAVKQAFYYLSIDLAKRNFLVRVRALIVMDCLLHRSKVFRELVCADIRTIVSNMELLKPSTPQPTGAIIPNAAELQHKGKQLVETWDHLYGDRYPQLRAVARYLREVLRLEMPNIVDNARLHQERSQRNKIHARNLIHLQYQQIIQSEWNFYMPEWRRSIGRLEEMLSLLFPRIGGDGDSSLATHEENEPLQEGDDVNWLEEDEFPEEDGKKGEVGNFKNSEPDSVFQENVGFDLDNIGAPYTLTISLATSANELENADNAILLQHIREIARHLANSAVPRLQRWKIAFENAAVLEAADSHVTNVVVNNTSGDSNLMSTGGSGSGGSSTIGGGVDMSHTELGKRSADALTGVVVTGEGNQQSTARLDNTPTQRLGEVNALLEEVRRLLTGKIRTLLRGETVSGTRSAAPAAAPATTIAPALS